MDEHIESLREEASKAREEYIKDLEHSIIAAWQAMYDNQGEYAYISANGIHALEEMVEKMGLKQ